MQLIVSKNGKVIAVNQVGLVEPDCVNFVSVGDNNIMLTNNDFQCEVGDEEPILGDEIIAHRLFES